MQWFLEKPVGFIRNEIGPRAPQQVQRATSPPSAGRRPKPERSRPSALQSWLLPVWVESCHPHPALDKHP